MKPEINLSSGLTYILDQVECHQCTNSYNKNVQYNGTNFKLTSISIENRKSQKSISVCVWSIVTSVIILLLIQTIFNQCIFNQLNMRDNDNYRCMSIKTCKHTLLKRIVKFHIEALGILLLFDNGNLGNKLTYVHQSWNVTNTVKSIF